MALFTVTDVPYEQSFPTLRRDGKPLTLSPEDNGTVIELADTDSEGNEINSPFLVAAAAGSDRNPAPAPAADEKPAKK